MKNYLHYLLVINILVFIAKPSYGQVKPSPGEVTPNIVSGTNTTIDQQPWQVYLSSGCGGSIIGPNTVLTAAHCVVGHSSVQVYAGVSFMSDFPTSQIRNSSKITVHPSWLGETNPNSQGDIAVIEVNTPFMFNSNVQPIRYDGGAGITNPGTIATASGWGVTSFGGSQPNQLQRTNIPIIDNANLQQNQYFFTLTNNMIAAGGNFTGICNGDSGGPLWVTANGQNLLIGVTSFRSLNGCANSSNPEIFTRVSSYCEWILQQVSTSANITGVGAVCNSANYSANNQPSNTNVTWSSSNPSALSISNSGVATRQNNYNDIVTLTATFTNNCGSASISRSVTVGPPLVSSVLINGQSTSSANICVNNFASVDAVPFDANSSYSWSVSNPGNAYITNSSSANTAFNAYTADCYGLTLQVSNACGYTQRNVTICAQNCFARYAVSPNPASDHIRVEFENVDNKEALPDEIILLSDASSKPIKTVNAQESVNFRNGNQLIIDVKDLPRGVYFLHIKNSRRSDKVLEAIRILLE